MKKINEEKIIKYLRSLILRTMFIIVIFLVMAIISKTSHTYKDLIVPFFNKLLSKVLNICSEQEFTTLLNEMEYEVNRNYANSYLEIEDFNPNYILEMLDTGASVNYPYIWTENMELINQITYTQIQTIYQYLNTTFEQYSKLYIIGDLDEELISNLASIVEKNFVFKNKPDDNFDKNNLDYIINKFKEKEKNYDIQDNTVVNYVYSNNKTSEKESYIGLFYNLRNADAKYVYHLNLFLSSIVEKINTELRTKKGLGYHCLCKTITSFNNHYLAFYARGPMRTPLDMQDDIQSVIYDILYNWDNEEFNDIKKDYFDMIADYQDINTYNKRVQKFISDNNNENEIKLNQNIPKDYKEAVEHTRNLFINPVRIGIMQYANYIDEEYINQEIEKRKNEKYFLNENINVVYTRDINYFK